MAPLPAALASLALALAAALPPHARASEAPLPPGQSRGEPITLDQALDLAARRNPELLGARADVEVARADRDAARSFVLPRLDLAAAFGHTFEGASSPRTTVVGGTPIPIGGGPATDAESYSLGLRLTQTLFDWQTFQDLWRAGLNVRGQERTYDERALALAFDVTSRFYDLVRAERSLAVLEKTVGRSEDLVARAEALFEAGKAPRSDALSARANLQNDRIAVEGQRARVAQARAALAQVLGRTDDPEALAVVAPEPISAGDLPAGEPPAVDALLARAKERRPILAASRAFVAAAEAGISSAEGAYFPTLSLQGNYDRSGPGLASSEGVYGDPSRAYSAAGFAVLSWNLLEGGRTRAEVSRARATLASTQAGQALNETIVSREIAAARAAVVALAAQVRLARDGLVIARDALSLATQRFEAGLASQIEIRDANLKVTQAELTLVQTRIDHAVATADLARAVGGAL